MSRNTIKFSCIFTLSLLLFYALVPIFPLSIVKAADIDENDLYKGLGLALILILISKLGQSQDRSSSGFGDIELDIPDSRYTDSDIHLLASIIHGEARGEPYEGQVAVGAVVLNRVKSSEFPNTIREVIYQEKQFSAVSDGQINLTPNSTSYQAAKDALNGKDPSLGALYFYNPKTAKTLWWLTTRDTTVVIGDHVFAK